MEKEIESHQICYYILDVTKHLLLNEPLKALENEKDYLALYQVAKFHELTSLVYYGIKDYLPDEIKIKWEAKVNQKLFKSISQLEEKEKLNEILNKNNIKHCFLKGCYLKTIYPEHDYREMADIDILIDKKDIKKVEKILIDDLGYKIDSNFGSHHLTFIKKPVYYVEIHYDLVDDDVKQFSYFHEMSKKLLSQDSLEIEMDINDYYLFFIFHAFHHYDVNGIGIRYIIDLYIFLLKNADRINKSYIEEQIEKLNIKEFYLNSISLMENIFYSKNNSINEKFVDMIFTSGTYGTTKNRVKNEMKKKKTNRFVYMLRRLFPHPKRLKTMYPILKKWPILYPVIYLSRPFKIFKVWKIAKSEIKEAMNYKEDE